MTYYDEDKILDAYEYMADYNSDIEVPIAFMKAAIQKGYKKKTGKIIKAKNRFNRFEQNVYDFEELERVLVEN